MLGLRRTATGIRLVLRINQGANQPGAEEREAAGLEVKAGQILLRVGIDSLARCHFAYSFDHRSFVYLGVPFQATVDRWIGAKVGLIAAAPPTATTTGHADFDWFRISRNLA